jgi:small conductance mechanosensitive channel
MEEIQALQKVAASLADFLVAYSFQIFGALILLVIAYFVANWLAGLLERFAVKHGIDVTLAKFLANLARLGVLGFATIVALGKFGITISPLVAALGAAAFGATFAIQAPLSNYAAGLAIILTQPFKVGDTVTVQGVGGVVNDVKLAYTVVIDADGVRILIPNKEIVGQIIHNSAANKIVESVIGVSYASDANKATDVVREALLKVKGVVHDPAPQVGIQEFADSSVNIGYRYWVPTAEYFQVSYAVNAAVYRAVKDAGLDIPFPQRDVHIVSKA